MGVRSYRARDHLARIYRDQGQLRAAEIQWRAALAERPDYTPACIGLGELYLVQERWPELEDLARRLELLPAGSVSGLVPRAQGHLARKEFALAQELLEKPSSGFTACREKAPLSTLVEPSLPWSHFAKWTW